ncbi:hypothetical protein C8N40_109132 [Pontibacter mucosus]|uniref:Response regulatory domain-containing protein n=1 Tax=Pontibacter mucosus TaxID=1649266 RepID=A0A2T5YE94_9BACT|nr:hypothetical protein C8N40_109132 [Pontibacter mucosus]
MYEGQLKGRCRIYVLTSSLDLSEIEHSKAYGLVYGFIHKPMDSKDVQVIAAEIDERE